jgi:saccharopine dehydrogenase-like NADP-dependent oxidoreductase
MKAKRILVLGGGMVGSAVALDLARDGTVEVTVADVSRAHLAAIHTRTGARVLEADLSRPDAVCALAAEHDLVVGALPSVIGYQTVAAVIEAGCDCVDISFMADDVLALDAEARAKGVTVVADCGIAPGISNMMVGFAAAQLSECERVDICVGGLPRERRWPYQYKAGFAPSDVIEEYVRPSKVVEAGCIVTKPALSEIELIDFPGVGTLEAFVTDGLRSLVHTVRAEFMQERTMRYPGHAELMRALRETGFLSKEPLTVNGLSVRPLDVTSALLFPKWTFGEGEADLTVMRVIVEGRDGLDRKRYEWNVLDFYDAATGLRSMSRTTGFSAAIVARLVARGTFRQAGVCAPEALGAQPGVLDEVLGELEERGVQVLRTAAHAAIA